MSKTGIPEWLGVKVPLKTTTQQEVNTNNKEEEEEKEEEEKPMCYVCFQFYFYKRCEGCAKSWKDKTRHPCRDYGNDLCPDCETDPAIFWR